jgi:hypothetical protein
MKVGLFSEIIGPFPKAGPRKIGGGKHGKTRVLTDTLEKNEIEHQKCKHCKVNRKNA